MGGGGGGWCGGGGCVGGGGGGGWALQVYKTRSPPFPPTLFTTHYSLIIPPTISAADVLT